MDAVTRAREHAQAIFEAGVSAVEPGAAVRAQLALQGGILKAGDARIPLLGRVVLVGMGKASAAMAQAVEGVLGSAISGGAVVTKYHHAVAVAVALTRVRLYESGHPVPDAAGVAGAQAIEESLQGLSARDLVIVCLSGGASALVVAPRPGISLADKQEVARLLLGSGADITAMNTVRKKLSRLKGGGLVRACGGARVLCLAISDVIGDDWSIIGSGPTAPDPSSFADAWAVVDRFGISARLPASVRALLQRGCAGAEPETLKPQDPACLQVTNLLLASNRQALQAARAQAQALGYAVTDEQELMQGDARTRGEAFARALQGLQGLAGPAQPRCLLAGGETTVVLGNDHGLGGRNQEFALAGACVLGQGHGAETATLALLCGGTDGTDGPTDAAGGLVDSDTVARARSAGLDAQAHLQRHDAYVALKTSGDLLMTGPTGTNVMDLAIGISIPGPA
jgi:glycerate 2-kinase